MTAMRSLPFRGLTITWDERVLEPRPWTEHQSAWAAELLAQVPPGPVLELCAGAGHIGLGAVRHTDRHLVMVDVDPAAGELARANARANGLGPRVEVRVERLEHAMGPEERYPLVLADPPWVRSVDTADFPEDPVRAIDGGDDGLELARACLAVIQGHLADGGSAILQLGTAEQAETIAAEAASRPAGAARVVETRTFERGVLVRLAR